MRSFFAYGAFPVSMPLSARSVAGKFIAERRPRLVILENVKGLLAPNPETEHPPIDFILRGRNPAAWAAILYLPTCLLSLRMPKPSPKLQTLARSLSVRGGQRSTRGSGSSGRWLCVTECDGKDARVMDAADKEMLMLPETVNAKKQLVEQADGMVANSPDLNFALNTDFQAADGRGPRSGTFANPMIGKSLNSWPLSVEPLPDGCQEHPEEGAIASRRQRRGAKRGVFKVVVEVVVGEVALKKHYLGESSLSFVWVPKMSRWGADAKLRPPFVFMAMALEENPHFAAERGGFLPVRIEHALKQDQVGDIDGALWVADEEAKKCFAATSDGVGKKEFRMEHAGKFMKPAETVGAKDEQAVSKTTYLGQITWMLLKFDGYQIEQENHIYHDIHILACLKMLVLTIKNGLESQEDCYQGTEPNADWGLSLIEGYGLRWDILYSYDWGLPQSRPRVYIVMVREDAGGQKAAERIFDVLTACAGRLPRGSCNDFLFPEGHPKLELAKSRVGKCGGGPRKACTKFTEALFRTKRQELGIPASDRPYSKDRAAGWFPQGTEKMVQQLDIIYAIAEKQGLDFNFLLADLSQQVSRGAWRDDGNIPTLTTGCCFYSFSRHRPFVGEECLRLNGFPLDEMNLDHHTENELIFLAGNAMSVPVIGAVLFAGLVSLDWGEGRHAVSRASLPSPLEQRPDIRKIVENSVVLAKVTPSLVDDDNEEAVDALEASEAVQLPLPCEEPGTSELQELALSRRAAVLLAMAKELSHEPAKREKMDKASSEPKKAGLLAAIQAVAVESTNEEDQEVEGDGTGWSERYSRIESQKAPDRQLCRWLQEAAHLLASMEREERSDSAKHLQLFVVKSLQVFSDARDSDLTNLAGEGLSQAVEQLWSKLRFSEAKALRGRLLTADLLSKLSTSSLDGFDSETWLNKAASLEGVELSSQRARLLQGLSSSRRRSARLLAALLRRWNHESVGDQELLWTQKAVESLQKAWTSADCPEAWVSFANVGRISKSCLEIAKKCENQNRPKSSQSFREIAHKLQTEVFAWRLGHALASATPKDFSQYDALQLESEQMTSEEAGLVILRQSVAWKLLQHLKLQGPKSPKAEASSRSLMHHADPVRVERFHASEQNLHDCLKTRLSSHLEVKLGNWSLPSLPQRQWEQELQTRISESSNQLNILMKGLAHLTVAGHFGSKVLPGQGYMGEIKTICIEAQESQLQAQQVHSTIQERCARLLLFRQLALANNGRGLLENREVVSTFIGILDQPTAVSLWPDLHKSLEKTKSPEWSKVYDAAVTAFQGHIPLEPGWSQSYSRAGLRFFQFGEGREIQTNWAWPLGTHADAHWSAPAPTTPPNAKPDPEERNDGSQEIGFMTPPQHGEPTTPSSSERRLQAGAKEWPSPPAPAKPVRFVSSKPIPAVVDAKMLMNPPKPSARPNLLRVPETPRVGTVPQTPQPPQTGLVPQTPRPDPFPERSLASAQMKAGPEGRKLALQTQRPAEPAGEPPKRHKGINPPPLPANRPRMVPTPPPIPVVQPAASVVPKRSAAYGLHEPPQGPVSSVEPRLTPKEPPLPPPAHLMRARPPQHQMDEQQLQERQLQQQRLREEQLQQQHLQPKWGPARKSDEPKLEPDVWIRRAQLLGAVLGLVPDTGLRALFEARLTEWARRKAKPSRSKMTSAAELCQELTTKLLQSEGRSEEESLGSERIRRGNRCDRQSGGAGVVSLARSVNYLLDVEGTQAFPFEVRDPSLCWFPVGCGFVPLQRITMRRGEPLVRACRLACGLHLAALLLVKVFQLPGKAQRKRLGSPAPVQVAEAIGAIAQLHAQLLEERREALPDLFRPLDAEAVASAALWPTVREHCSAAVRLALLESLLEAGDMRPCTRA
ncbi:Hmox2 [Symbiodinium sp. CCMP2456]|nr:Hmox2 [Symbiodinium sp. CCMP2456]